MNHLDYLVHDWGSWNRAYTRILIRTRGYRLVSMARTLPVVRTVPELSQCDSGALLWLKPRQAFRDLRPPRVALGEDAEYVVDYYIKEFAPETTQPWIAYFRNPILYGRQFSILDSKKQAFEECFTRDRRWRDGVPKRGSLDNADIKKVRGTFLLAGAEFHNHFAHLFCDVLPRSLLFEETGLWDKFPGLLPPPSHGFAEKAWQKMGLAGDGSERWDDTCWEVEGLYFASPFKKFCSWTPESAAWVREKLSPGLDRKVPGKKLFYISRRNGRRPALNEDEILAALKPWGVTVVEPDLLPLPEQIKLFSEAGLIIGPQGAGIQNSLWAPRGCMVLEFISPRFFSGVYWTLAESLGHPYGLVTGLTAPDSDPVTVGSKWDPRLISRALEMLERSR